MDEISEKLAIANCERYDESEARVVVNLFKQFPVPDDLFNGAHTLYYLFADVVTIDKLLRDEEILEEDFCMYVEALDTDQFKSEMGYLPESDQLAVCIAQIDNPEELTRLQTRQIDEWTGVSVWICVYLAK
jgi:hypothetical protein